MKTIKSNSNRKSLRRDKFIYNFSKKLGNVYLGENVFGKVSMIRDGQHLTVHYKHPNEIVEGREYVTVNYMLKEVIRKDIEPISKFPRFVKRYTFKNFMPNNIYDIENLDSTLRSNRSTHSPSRQYFKINRSHTIEGRNLPAGFMALTDLEFSIDSESIYILFNKHAEAFTGFCVLSENGGVVTVTDEDGTIILYSKSDFENTFDMYILLTLTKSFERDEN